ncbi:hypothetical protein BGZ60DRAFT_489582 [Tricladium varicosporioides]|nr:hypothetical protein BGZ60DRAFT_489582 [Hymenoscyphus varicosporioides]
MAGIKFYGSQIGGEAVTSHSHTKNPIALLWHDIWLALNLANYLPMILWPFKNTGTWCELYPGIKNIWCMTLHIVLFCLQLMFIISIPLWVCFPVGVVGISVAIFLMINRGICFMLNGGGRQLNSDPKYAQVMEEHKGEQWVYINGIGVGKHWLQSNLDRLALTFGRPILGIHNRSNGFIFDIVECMIQRNFNYASADIRTAFSALKAFLYDESLTKVILILHGQGAIEGGMVLDWLLGEVPSDLLAKIEIYTFGNVANHFNNPHRSFKSEEKAQAASHKRRSWTILPTTQTNNNGSSKNGTSVDDNGMSDERIIHHIEHYSHSEDFIARFGILYFISHCAISSSPERPSFMGRTFKQIGAGHLFNQHYLDAMFPLHPAPKGQTGVGGSGFTGCSEDSEFMEMKVEWASSPSVFAGLDCREGMEESARALRTRINRSRVSDEDDNLSSPWSTGRGSKVLNEEEKRHGKNTYKVKELSRLWQYRNGRCPPVDTVDARNARILGESRA